MPWIQRAKEKLSVIPSGTAQGARWANANSVVRFSVYLFPYWPATAVETFGVAEYHPPSGTLGIAWEHTTKRRCSDRSHTLGTGVSWNPVRSGSANARVSVCVALQGNREGRGEGTVPRAKRLERGRCRRGKVSCQPPRRRAVRFRGKAGAGGPAPALAYAAFFFEAVFFGTEDALMEVGFLAFFTGFFTSMGGTKTVSASVRKSNSPSRGMPTCPASARPQGEAG